MENKLLSQTTTSCLNNYLSHYKYWTFLIFALCFMMGNLATAQVTIFSEDFENPSYPLQTDLNNANPTGWTNVNMAGGNNRWWVLGGNRINAISGDYSLAISRNNPHTGGGAKPRYNANNAAENIAQSPLIDATGYTSVTLDFDWICEGENNFDFGRVAYSLDGTNWTILNQDYVLQSTAQNVTNLDLSVVDGQQFYLGFYWENDGSVGNNPSFVIDNIEIKATPSAGAPANDNCSNAITLISDVSCNPVTGSTVDATQSISGCIGTSDDDVWYAFIATSSEHTITVEANTINDIVFQVFESNCAGSSIICQNSTNGSATETNTLSSLTIGTNYFVRVYSRGSNSSNSGTFTICITQPITTTPPANDECSNAIVLTPDTSCNGTIGTTVNATQSISGCIGTSDDDVWYSFIATSSEHTITVEANTINDIVFQVFESNCAGSSIICQNSTNGSATETNTLSSLTIGTNYFVRVYSRGSNSSNSGTFTICIIEVPENDSCNNAISLTPSFICNPVIGNTAGGTASSGDACTGIANDDVWYTFTATRSQHTVVVEAGTINDIVFEVSVGCGGTTLACVDNTSGSETETATLTALNVGTDYRIRIHSASNNMNDSGSFSICVLDTCVPSTELGTDTLACPSVDTGGVGLSGAAVELSCSGGNATLEANYLDLGETTSYDVGAIDFNPPYQFTCLENPISVNVDDVFSDKIDLPFNFCFYGNTYDSVVIGSNGAISFDADRLAGTYAGWFIQNDIPSTVNSDAGYFGPSIFGVHHDVDPSKGGEIGYQLITLDSGCRALVAAWDQVPMYRDNSILYSGMMVLYEDTNIIDVYIKEKNIDGNNNPWNNGRATVGLQANATEATVPPGRNSLSPNWTATNEAWRFTPSGASITTLNWYADGVLIDSAVNQRQIDVSPTETTTYTAEVTYDLCNSIVPLVESDDTTVTIIGQKTWNGSQNQAWDNPNNWTPVGVPLSTNCITIPGTGNDPIMTGSVNGNGLNLTVVNGATLIQEPNSTLTIEEDINVNAGGTYNLQNSASLIQIDDTPNVVDGTFTMDRTTTMRSNDYIYWSSPVTNFNIENVSSGTPNGFKYEWSPFVDRTPGPPGTPLNFGEWSNYNTGVMDVGKGYIIKGPTSHPSTPSPFTATFSGNPNNGDIIQPIARGSNFSNDYTYQPYANGDLLLITSDDDNWNLIGNPYPSAINVTDFLSLPANSNIDGFVYLWTHGTDIGTGNADPFYEDYAYNYNVADYIAVNSSGVSDPLGFNGNIGAGQGFFVLMNDLGTSDAMGNGQEIVTFTNSMRSNTYANDQFYRSSDTSDDDTKNRIWLDYISPNGMKNTTLVAYIEGATNDADRMFDALKTKGAGLNLYSLIDDKGYLIQGRQLPFNNNDRVPLGININEPGIQTIAINTLQGLFDDYNNLIFLEDLQTGVIHNLKESPYTFSSEEGIFDERFVLRYSSDTLGTEDFNTASGIKVFKESDHIIINSSFESIKSVEIFDILGRSIFSNKAVNLNRMTIDTLKPEERILFLKIILNDGKQKLAKIIF